MKSNKKNKIIFIVFVSIFALLWLASLVFFGISNLSSSATKSIETWYSDSFDEKTLNLAKVSQWATLISTCCLLITLLANEIKRKYSK